MGHGFQNFTAKEHNQMVKG